MAKKKEIVLRSGAEEVPAGDVNITYEGTRIAGFSEETEATLKTGGTRVLSDIDVSYTGPLPASTAEDAGKVLTVGSTGAAEWGENVHVCIIEAAVDTQTMTATYTLISDFANLLAASEAMKPVYLIIRMVIGSAVVISRVVPNFAGKNPANPSDNQIMISASLITDEGTSNPTYESNVFTVNSDSTVSCVQTKYTLTATPIS